MEKSLKGWDGVSPSSPHNKAHPIMDAVDNVVCYWGRCIINGIILVPTIIYIIIIAAPIVIISTPILILLAIRSLIKYGDCRAIHTRVEEESEYI